MSVDVEPNHRVVLCSFDRCPSLAIRNLKHYAQGDAHVARTVQIDLCEYPVHTLLRDRTKALTSYSFVTRFDALLAAIQRHQPTLVGFSCYLWNVELCLHAAALIKRVVPSTFILCGGPEMSARASDLLARAPQVDGVVVGDGEVPFLELCRRLDQLEPTQLRGVPRLFFRDGGLVVSGATSGEPLCLSRLDGVYRTCPVPTENVTSCRWPLVLFETQRGCPFACAYCTYGNRPIIKRPIDSVVADLLELLVAGETVEIVDPSFTSDSMRAKEILSTVAAQKPAGKIYFETYPTAIDEEMARLAKAAGVVNVGIGLQSIADNALEAVGRRQALSRVEQTVDILRGAGLSFYFDVIYGLPGSGMEDFTATLDFLHSHGVFSLVAYRLLGLPGSKLSKEAERYGLVFSPSPPYELLESETMTHREISLCGALVEAMHVLASNGSLRSRINELFCSAADLAAALAETDVLEASDPADIESVLHSLATLA